MKKNTIKCPHCGKESTVTANIVRNSFDRFEAVVIFDNDGFWSVDEENEKSMENISSEKVETIFSCNKCGQDILENKLAKAAQAHLKQLKANKSKVKAK